MAFVFLADVWYFLIMRQVELPSFLDQVEPSCQHVYYYTFLSYTNNGPLKSYGAMN